MTENVVNLENLPMLWLLARLLIGGTFVVSGIHNFRAKGVLLPMMEDRKVPFPSLTLHIGAIWQVVAGFAIVFDYMAGYAALSLIPFVVMATLMFQRFWQVEDAEAREIGLFSFVDHMAIVGGLFFIVALNFA